MAISWQTFPPNRTVLFSPANYAPNIGVYRSLPFTWPTAIAGVDPGVVDELVKFFHWWDGTDYEEVQAITSQRFEAGVYNVTFEWTTWWLPNIVGGFGYFVRPYLYVMTEHGLDWVALTQNPCPTWAGSVPEVAMAQRPPHAKAINNGFTQQIELLETTQVYAIVGEVRGYGYHEPFYGTAEVAGPVITTENPREDASGWRAGVYHVGTLT